MEAQLEIMDSLRLVAYKRNLIVLTTRTNIRKESVKESRQNPDNANGLPCCAVAGMGADRR